MKADFIQCYHDIGKRVQERTELNSEYSKDSWGFIASKQSEGARRWKITKRRFLGVGGFLLNWPNRILAKSRLRT